MKLVKTALISLACLLSACSNVKERYLISVLELLDNTNATWLEENAAHFDSLKQAGGRILSPILHIEKELENAAQPSYTSTLPGNAMVLFAFPDRRSLNNYIAKLNKLDNTDNTEGLQSLINSLNIKAMYSAKPFNPMGMMSKYPAINNSTITASSTSASTEAFIMVNGIQMRSFLNPMTPWRIMRHMSSTTPKLEQAGVQLIKPYEITQTLLGEANLDVIFLTLWPSENTFHSLHSSKAFIEFTRANRNKAFSNFTESKALFMN